MKVYLVRHGQAKNKSQDPARSLNKDGIKEIQFVAQKVKDKYNPDVKYIFHSGKARAKQTAEIFADIFSCDKLVKESDALRPEDDPVIWAERLHNYDGDVMLFGHLPYMSYLAGELTRDSGENKIIDFPTGGTACLEFSGKKPWELLWKIHP